MTTAVHGTTRNTIGTASGTSGSSAARPAARRVVAGAGVAAATAAVALFGYGTIAQAAEGKLYAGDPGASHAVRIAPSSFSVGMLFCVALGTLLAVGIARWASAPARTWVRTSVALATVSLVPALYASHSDWSTRLTLVGGHVLAALIVIPVVAKRLLR